MGQKIYLCLKQNYFSLIDLINIRNGTLKSNLQKYFEYLNKHCRICDNCLKKSYICQICNSQQRIFIYDILNTVKCKYCLRIFHKECYLKKKDCKYNCLQ